MRTGRFCFRFRVQANADDKSPRISNAQLPRHDPALYPNNPLMSVLVTLYELVRRRAPNYFCFY